MKEGDEDKPPPGTTGSGGIVHLVEGRSDATPWAQANLLDLTHDSIFVRDMTGAIQYWNRAAEELYGWTAQQALGKVAHELLKAVFPTSVQEVEAHVLRRNGNVDDARR